MKDFGALVPELPETLDGILLWASVLLHQLAEPEEGCESKGHRDGLDSGIRGDGRCSSGDNNPTWQISISSKPDMQTSKVLSGSAHGESLVRVRNDRAKRMLAFAQRLTTQINSSYHVSRRVEYIHIPPSTIYVSRDRHHVAIHKDLPFAVRSGPN